MSEGAESHEHTDPLPPRETSVLYGHAAAESALLESYRSGRLPHGWLLAMKGVYPREELKALPSVFRVVAVPAMNVPGLEGERHLVIMQAMSESRVA